MVSKLFIASWCVNFVLNVPKMVFQPRRLSPNGWTTNGIHNNLMIRWNRRHTIQCNSVRARTQCKAINYRNGLLEFTPKMDSKHRIWRALKCVRWAKMIEWKRRTFRNLNQLVEICRTLWYGEISCPRTKQQSHKFANMKFAALFCIVVIVSSSCLCDASDELPVDRVRRSFDDMVKVKTVINRWKSHSKYLWFGIFCLINFRKIIHFIKALWFRGKKTLTECTRIWISLIILFCFIEFSSVLLLRLADCWNFKKIGQQKWFSTFFSLFRSKWNRFIPIRNLSAKQTWALMERKFSLGKKFPANIMYLFILIGNEEIPIKKTHQFEQVWGE